MRQVPLTFYQLLRFANIPNTKRTMNEPKIAIIKLRISNPLMPPNPSKVATKPPTTAPTIPNTMVSIIPPHLDYQA